MQNTRSQAYEAGFELAGRAEPGDTLMVPVDYTPAEKLDFAAGIEAAGRQRQLIKKGIGDINSTERGTAARYNDGKAKLQYMPMHLLVDRVYWGDQLMSQKLHDFGDLMTQFEEGDDDAIFKLLKEIDLGPTCDVFDFGAQKYKAFNWMKGFPWMSVIASFKRHWLALVNEEEIDPESGLPHWGHLGCNVVFLAQFTRTWRQGDDRPDPSLFETGDA